ncbi:MAG: DNA repair protein RadC [Actinobacteria bacterium]|nr:DNA repair protein RadC [Actinomycetota bacterium]
MHLSYYIFNQYFNLWRKKFLNNNERAGVDYIPIKKWPEEERPREKLIKHGVEYLTNSELLAIMLRTGVSNNGNSKSALDLAKVLLSRFTNLNELIGASATELIEVRGISWAKASQIIAAIELGRRVVSEKNGKKIIFRCSEEVANYYIPLLKDLKKEQFRVILLDVKNRVIKEVLISQGSLTSSVVHPREVIKPVIKESAASVIFIHNHPSGDPEPSIDDIEITQRLSKSFNIIGINILDHIIVGNEGYFSFKQKQLI